VKKYPFILFDLDGMLVNTDEGVFNCVSYALSKFGIFNPDKELLKKYMGPPLKYSFETFSGLSKEQSEQALAFYRERYKDVGIFECYAFEGIPELLSALRDKGVVLGTATSKPEEYARRILEKLDIAKFFHYITGASFDDTRAHKDQVVVEAIRRFGSPPLEDILLIGDRKYDTEGAHKVGIACCGVYMGCAEENEHETAGADYIAHGIEGLTKILLD